MLLAFHIVLIALVFVFTFVHVCVCVLLGALWIEALIGIS